MDKKISVDDNLRPYFVVFGLLLSVAVLSGIALSSNIASADEPYHSSSANASVTVSAACTLSSTGGGTYSETINNGHSEEINGSTISAVCNDPNGYSLYAIGFTNDSYNDNNDKLISTTNPDLIISTDTTTSGSNSSWAMKVNPTTGSAPTITNNFDNYHIVPATYAQVATYNSATATSSSTGASVDAKYQVYISGSQPAGTYTGKVKYTLVHPNNNTPKDGPIICSTNKICYSPSANDVVGTMGQQSASADTEIVLLASNYSRTGYGFVGWSDKYDWELNANDSTGNGTGTNAGYHIYGPMATITAPTNMDSGLSLYAVWAPSRGNIQNYTCPNDIDMSIGTVTALTDQRDNQTYAIAKLADEQCWMIENLRLESTNSDNSTGALAQGYATSFEYGDFSGLASAENTNFSNTIIANSLYYSGTQEGTASIDIGATNYPGFRMPRYNNWNNQSISANRPQYPTTRDAKNNITNASMYSYGNYYTWSAAAADTTHYSSGDHGTTSICPSGWRLPIGNQSTLDKSFGSLSVALGGPADGAIANNYSSPRGTVMSERFRSYPNNFIYSGVFTTTNTSGIGNLGTYGYYWSSTVRQSISSYLLSYGYSSVRPGMDDLTKHSGGSIRCISNS